MKTEKLAHYLRKLCIAYSEKCGASDYYTFKDKSLEHIQLTLDRIKLEFVYSLKGSEIYPVSTLSCRVYFEKNSPYFYELQELIDYLDLYDYHCYAFPYIENQKRMEACFSYITDFLEYRKEEILSLCDKAEIIRAKKLSEIERVFNYSDKLTSNDNASKDAYYSSLFKLYSDFLIPRYTSAEPYVNFVGCYFSAALKGYEELGELTGYEKKLVEFMKEQNAPYQAVPEECASILDVQEYMKNDTKSFILLIVISVFIFSFLFIFLQVIVNLIYMSRAQFADYANPFIPGICGIIPGIVGAIVFRKRLEPFLKRNKKQALEFYDLLYEPSGTNVPQFAFILALGIGLLIFCLICRPKIAAYDTYLKYSPGDSLVIKYEKYDYNDFDTTYYIGGYYTDKSYTEYVEDPHYVFAFNGRRYISVSDLTITEKEFEELKNIIDPKSDGYKIRDYPAIEDVL